MNYGKRYLKIAKKFCTIHSSACTSLPNCSVAFSLWGGLPTLYPNPCLMMSILACARKHSMAFVTALSHMFCANMDTPKEAQKM